MTKREIIIAGGGAAGLLAARLLSQKFQVTIIEYRSELGGRIRTGTFRGSNVLFEQGAEFVHGDLPITMQLLQEAGLDHIAADGKMLRRQGNRWTEEEEMIEHWDKLIRLMNKEKEDLHLHEFLLKHFAGEAYADFRRHIHQFAQGFDVADPMTVSVHSLRTEWEAEQQNYRIPQGYGALIKFLETECRKNGCRIITGDAVRQVDWSEADITVVTASGLKIAAEKIIVSIPISLYSDVAGPCAINFTPPIRHYIDASRNIGFGTVIKFIFKFKQILWEPGTAFLLSDEMIPTWWTQYPLDNKCLTGWVGGPMADRIAMHSDEELIELAITSLSNLFDVPRAEIYASIDEHFVFNWQQYSEVRGAYSFSTTASSEARRLLNTSLADSLYFIGEGLYEGKYAGTVEAAFATGKRVAESILRMDSQFEK